MGVRWFLGFNVPLTAQSLLGQGEVGEGWGGGGGGGSWV